jgi:SAM-dependent methyltransferase
VKFKDNILVSYASMAPLALALERYLECQIYRNLTLERPILDLGCGDGLYAWALFAEPVDTGIDPNPRELETASRLGAYRELIACAGHSVPKPDGSYRTVFSNSVLEHIETLEPVFREVHRLLAPGGRFYFTVPSNRFDEYSVVNRLLSAMGLTRLAARWRRRYNAFWRHYHCYAASEWEQRGRRCGFTVVESRTYDPRRVCTLNDALVPFGLPAFACKRLLNRWVLFPALRRVWIAPVCLLAERFLRGGQRAEEGGLVFVALEKEVLETEALEKKGSA